MPPYSNWRTAKFPGLKLVISLMKQLSGTIDLKRENRIKFTIVCPEKKQNQPYFPDKKAQISKSGSLS